MVRPGKKPWKLFTKKRHESLADDGGARSTSKIEKATSQVIGKSVPHENAAQKEQSKKVRSWFGRKAHKKRIKKGQNQDHNDTFQTVETEDDPRSDDAAGTVVDGQLELFAVLASAVPKELVARHRPASDDDFSQTELKISHNFVNDGSDPGMEVVEACIVPKNKPEIDSKDVDDLFSSIRVSPLGGAELDSDTLTCVSDLSKTRDCPSVDPFPAFDEMEEIPEFWRDVEVTDQSEVAQNKAVSFLERDAGSLLASKEDANLSVKRAFTSKDDQFANATSSQCATDGGAWHSKSDFSQGSRQEVLELFIDPHLSAERASGESSVGEVGICDTLPEDEEAGDRYFLEGATCGKLTSQETSPRSKNHVTISTAEKEKGDAMPEDYGILDSHPAFCLCTGENGRSGPLDQKTPEGSIPMLLPSHGSSSSTKPNESLHSVDSDGGDCSVSSESGTIRWTPSDLASNELDFSPSAVTEALCSVPSSRSRQCSSSYSVEDTSPSGTVEPCDDDTGLQYDGDCWSHGETKSVQLDNKDAIAEIEGSASSEIVEGAKFSDLSVSSEPKRTSNLSAIGMSDDDKLTPVKRVSSVGHVNSVGHLSVCQHSVANSVTPVRQNCKRTGLYHNAHRKRTENYISSPSKNERSLSGSRVGEDLNWGSCPPEYYGSIEEHKKDLEYNFHAAAVNDACPGVIVGFDGNSKDRWREKEIPGKVDWPEEDDEFPSNTGSDNSQEQHLSYKQLATATENRSRQARELRKRGSVYEAEDEDANTTGLPFISGIRMDTFSKFADDFDCSFFTSGKHVDDASDDGSGIALSTFDEEDESFVSYDDEETHREEDIYRTTGSTWTREARNDGIDHALKWADENFLCSQS